MRGYQEYIRLLQLFRTECSNLVIFSYFIPYIIKSLKNKEEKEYLINVIKIKKPILEYYATEEQKENTRIYYQKFFLKQPPKCWNNNYFYLKVENSQKYYNEYNENLKLVCECIHKINNKKYLEPGIIISSGYGFYSIFLWNKQKFVNKRRTQFKTLHEENIYINILNSMKLG